MEELVSDAVRELAPKHPIVYDAYNLCELASQKKLSDFSIAVLKDICSSFDIDLSDVTVRRKKPYIEKLVALRGVHMSALRNELYSQRYCNILARVSHLWK